MKKIALAAAIILAPALAHAQSSVQVQSQARVDASAQGSSNGQQAATSADANAKVEANVKLARARHLPEQPIRDRAAEGRAKGASEAQVAAASGRALAELQASYDAMVKAGRKEPSDAEVARGGELVARGFTSAQIEAVARKAPSDRSLVVAFETLTSLQARGASTARAAARVEQLLAARASDEQLHDVAVNATAAAHSDVVLRRGAGSANGAAAAGVAGSAAGVAGSAAAGAGAAATGAVGQGTAGVAGTATGALGGAIRRP